jgi:hypothetical protein
MDFAHVLVGKPRKSDVSDLRNLERRYRVNPISVSTFPGHALTLIDVKDQERQKAPGLSPGLLQNLAANQLSGGRPSTAAGTGTY